MGVRRLRHFERHEDTLSQGQSSKPSLLLMRNTPTWEVHGAGAPVWGLRAGHHSYDKFHRQRCRRGGSPRDVAAESVSGGWPAT